MRRLLYIMSLQISERELVIATIKVATTASATAWLEDDNFAEL